MTFAGTDAGEFHLVSPRKSPLAAGSTATFVVAFAPAAAGRRAAEMRITTNDPLASPFVVNLTGAGGGPSVLQANYASGAEVPLRTSRFTATGPAAWHNLGTFARPPAALTPGEQWRLTWFGTPSNSGDAADDATPRNDGVTNLMKFATGMDPDQPGTVAIPLVRSGVDPVLTYSRSKAAVADGVVFTVEWSDDLSEGSWRTDRVAESASDQGATDLVTATLPAGPGPARFVRLRVHRR